MKKPIRILLVIVLSLIFLISTAITVFAIRDRVMYRDFYRNAEKAMPMPGVRDGYIQQGFEYIENEKLWLSCGYMKNKTASRIYLSRDGEKWEPVFLKTQDGKDYTGHAGGVASEGDIVYLTDGQGILMYHLADIKDGDGNATAFDRFETGFRNAYVTVRGGILYAGEFYYTGPYETPEAHRLTTPAGEQNPALIGCFRLGADGKPESSLPTSLFSVPAMVQGMTFDRSGNLLLSTSWGLKTSHIYAYDLSTAVSDTVQYEGKETAVLYMDSSNLLRVIEAPPMAEEMVYFNGKLLMMNESASSKYIFGKFTSGKSVMAYDYDGTK